AHQKLGLNCHVAALEKECIRRDFKLHVFRYEPEAAHRAQIKSSKLISVVVGRLESRYRRLFRPHSPLRHQVIRFSHHPSQIKVLHVADVAHQLLYRSVCDWINRDAGILPPKIDSPKRGHELSVGSLIDSAVITVNDNRKITLAESCARTDRSLNP